MSVKDKVRGDLTPGGPKHYLFGTRQSGEAPPTKTGWQVTGIFLILVFAAIAAGRDFLMPVTLGVLLFFVFTPVRRFAGRRGIPDWLSALAVCLLLIVAVGMVFILASGPINDLISNYPQIVERLREKVSSLQEAMNRFQDVALQGQRSAAEQMAPVSAADLGATVPEAAAPALGSETSGYSIGIRVLERIAMSTPVLIGQFFFVIFLLFFMMSSGDLLYLKIVQSFDRMREKRAAYLALREIESSLGNYLASITLINFGLGVATGLTMWAWGMPAPILFGVAAFVLNFIPYLGAMAGVALAFMVGLVLHDDIWTPLLIAASWFGLTTIEGQFVTPYMVSRRLRMNIVVVFLSVTLWAWLWSVIGMVIAVPVLVVIRVLAEHIESWEKFGNFLEGEDEAELGSEEEEDEREAADLAREAARSAAIVSGADSSGESAPRP